MDCYVVTKFRLSNDFGLKSMQIVFLTSLCFRLNHYQALYDTPGGMDRLSLDLKHRLNIFLTVALYLTVSSKLKVSVYL